MDTSNHAFLLGALSVDPVSRRLKSASGMEGIEPLVMNVLTFLAARNGKIVLRNEFLTHIWKNFEASDESLTRAISVLRKVLRKLDPETVYIETVSKRGYRLAAAVVQVRPVETKEDGQPLSANANEDARTKSTELVLQGRSLNERPFHTDVLEIAASLLLVAISLNPQNADAHSELGHSYSLMSTYVHEGNKAALIHNAAQCAERAMAISPGLGFPLTLIALEQFTFGNILDAIAMTEEAYRRDPQNAEIALRLGYFFAAIGLTRRAMPYVEKAVSLAPSQGRNLQILATVKLANGDLEEADIMAKRACDMQHHFGCETFAASAFAMCKYELAGQRLLQGSSYLADFLGDEFDDPVVWEKIVADAYSPDQSTREALGRWIKKLLFIPGTFPSIPLAQVIVRSGPASAFFEIMGNKPPPGTHSTLLCIWGQTVGCHLKLTRCCHRDLTRSVVMLCWS